MRTFDTGATRNTDTDKLDFDGFLSPQAVERFARYMHSHRLQADGVLRDSDNWKKGIPKGEFIKSMWRHFFAVWEGHHSGRNIQEDLCALLFNVQGYLHEDLKAQEPLCCGGWNAYGVYQCKPATPEQRFTPSEMAEYHNPDHPANAVKCPKASEDADPEWDALTANMTTPA